jgi:hypothetical protein
MPDLQTKAVGTTVAYDRIVTILEGETDSSFADIGGLKLGGLYIPIAFAGSSIKFKTSPSDTGQNLNKGKVTVDDGSDYVAQVGTPAEGDAYIYLSLPLVKFAGIKYLQLIAGSQQTEDVQIILATTLF